jgi:hypothetical protein
VKCRDVCFPAVFARFVCIRYYRIGKEISVVVIFILVDRMFTPLRRCCCPRLPTRAFAVPWPPRCTPAGRAGCRRCGPGRSNTAAVNERRRIPGAGEGRTWGSCSSSHRTNCSLNRHAPGKVAVSMGQGKPLATRRNTLLAALRIGPRSATRASVIYYGKRLPSNLFQS